MTERLIMMLIAFIIGAIAGGLLVHGAHVIREVNDD